MKGRILKILILVLCGTLLFVPPASAGFFDFLFGTPTPTPAPVPTAGPTGQVSAVTPDLATIISLLQTINSQLTLVAENTQPQAKGIATGNLILFDTGGDQTNTITNGTSVITLPGGTCDIGLYTNNIAMFATVEEMNAYTPRGINSRNKQNCLDVTLCRATVTLDSGFPYIYLTYKPYSSSDRLDRVTLSYRCNPL